MAVVARFVRGEGVCDPSVDIRWSVAVPSEPSTDIRDPEERPEDDARHYSSYMGARHSPLFFLSWCATKRRIAAARPFRRDRRRPIATRHEAGWII